MNKRQIQEQFCWEVGTVISAEQESAFENTQECDDIDESYWLGVVDGLEIAGHLMWECIDYEED